MQGPTAFREGGSADPSEGTTKSLSRTTSMLKPTDRTHNVLASEASLSASLIPVVERLLLVSPEPCGKGGAKIYGPWRQVRVDSKLLT